MPNTGRSVITITENETLRQREKEPLPKEKSLANPKMLTGGGNFQDASTRKTSNPRRPTDMNPI
jgi:hypothetical protein